MCEVLVVVGVLAYALEEGLHGNYFVITFASRKGRTKAPLGVSKTTK